MLKLQTIYILRHKHFLKPFVKLQGIGLIDSNDERKYQIVDSILRLWLKNEFNTKGVYPYRVS